METKARRLLFGKRFLISGLISVCEKLVQLAEHSLDHDVYVDTLLGMHFDGAKGVPAESFLIFDFHRIFLHKNSALPDGPKIDSVVRHLIDDYPVHPVKVLAGYAREQFQFFYPLETLEIIPLLWGGQQPGTIITVDLSTAEIRRGTASVHPECEQPRVVESAADCLLDPTNIRLQDRITGPDMRTGISPKLDDLVQHDIGLIRQEHKRIGQFSYPVAMTEVAAGNTERFICSGRSRTMPQAVATARYEAVERHQANFLNPQAALVYGSYAAFNDVAIDPRSLCFTYVKADPFKRRIAFEDDVSMYWCSAQELLSEKTWLIPAQEIWFNTRLLPKENHCTWSTTNGCALGSSMEEAALFAILEIIERDAFLIAWYLRRRCRKIIPESVPLEDFQFLLRRARHTYGNYSIQFFDITADTGIPVVMCAAVKQAGKGPKVLLALGCRLTCGEAALAALKDLAGMADTNSYDEKRGRELLEKPEEISAPEDHAAFYSLEENFGRLEFMDFESTPVLSLEEVDRGAWIRPSDKYNVKAVVEEIATHLRDIGLTVLLKNLSHREFLRRNLFCVRAIVPHSYPMWFGYYNARFNMSERLKRLSQCFLGKPLHDQSELNLEVHPFD